MNVTVWAWRCVCDNKGCLGIISHLAQIDANEEDTAPFIDNLEMTEVFKDEDEEEGASVTDLIN